MRHIANAVIHALFTAAACALLFGAVNLDRAPSELDLATHTTPYYEVVNDETAAGDLDLPYAENTDYEDDALSTGTCTRKVVNESAYGPEVYVYRCEGTLPE